MCWLLEFVLHCNWCEKILKTIDIREEVVVAACDSPGNCQRSVAFKALCLVDFRLVTCFECCGQKEPPRRPLAPSVHGNLSDEEIRSRVRAEMGPVTDVKVLYASPGGQGPRDGPADTMAILSGKRNGTTVYSLGTLGGEFNGCYARLRYPTHGYTDGTFLNEMFRITLE